MTAARFLKLVQSGDIIVPGSESELQLIPEHVNRTGRPAAGPGSSVKSRELLRALVAFRKVDKKK